MPSRAGYRASRAVAPLRGLPNRHAKLLLKHRLTAGEAGKEQAEMGLQPTARPLCSTQLPPSAGPQAACPVGVEPHTRPRLLAAGGGGAAARSPHLRKPSMPAAMHSTRSRSEALAVMATMGVWQPSWRISCGRRQGQGPRGDLRTCQRWQAGRLPGMDACLQGAWPSSHARDGWASSRGARPPSPPAWPPPRPAQACTCP